MRIKNYHPNCSACRACQCICPKKAINLVESDKGFLYPSIDDTICIECGLCYQVCQCFHSPVKRNYKGFLAYYDNDAVRTHSQSGGLFYGVAEVILSENGIVYGCAINDDLSVQQIKIESINDLSKLQGSKYVQSDTYGTYNQVARDLKNNKVVIYSGTSCMIDGLYLYLANKKIDYTNLFTCDLICYGVLSPKLFRENLQRISNQHEKKIKNVNFRDKKFGWHSSIQTYIFEDNSQISEKYWAELMYSGFACRECCYQCQYVDISKKPADMTMGDFWGIEKILPNINDDNKGFSLAIVRSSKIEKLLRKSQLTIQEVPVEHLMDNNRNEKTVQKPYLYDQFWRDYLKHGLSYCLKKYTVYGGIPFKLKRKLLKTINHW